MQNLTIWSPRMLSLLRIITALLFMEHGLMKLVHFPAAMPGAPEHLPPLMLAAGLIEVIGGAAIALGLFTRIAAFICSGQWRSPISWRTCRKASGRLSTAATRRSCSASFSCTWSSPAAANGRPMP